MRVRGNRMGVDAPLAVACGALHPLVVHRTLPLLSGPTNQIDARPQSPGSAAPQLWFLWRAREQITHLLVLSPAGFVYCSMATAGVSLLERQKQYQEAIDRLHQLLGEGLELGISRTWCKHAADLLL